MIYVMSDLHGCYDKYISMLKKISFSESDTLYILGDVVDRGKDGIKILFDMLMRENVVPFLGNHDYIAFTVLQHMTSEERPDWWQSLHDDWLIDGGAPTKDAFTALSERDQKAILYYLMDFSIYEELDVKDKKFVLSHAGIDNFKDGKPLHEYELCDFITGRMDYSKKYGDDFILVSGHTPTALIDEEYQGRIYKNNNHIAIDCGAAFGSTLGCICLDTMEEFYV